MARKSDITDPKPRTIEITDQPKRRISPAELAAALAANPHGQQNLRSLDSIGLAELGVQLLNRLRSSGGRPSLADAVVNCRVPMSAEDLNTLENMVAQIGEAVGAKPSVGQLVSVIVRLRLNALQRTPEEDDPHLGVPDIIEQFQDAASAFLKNAQPQDSAWLDVEDAKRKKCRQVQDVVQQAGTTWGKKRVA